MLTSLSFLISILIGGVITGNILGDMRNKAAGIVFYSWKGVQVFRKYVDQILNPKSVAQVAQRTVFLTILRSAQDLLLDVVQPFWKKYAIKQSEYNAFMSYNIKALNDNADGATMLLVRNNLQLPTVTTTDVTVTSAGADVSIDPIGSFTGSANLDYIRLVAVNVTTGNAWLSSAVALNIANPLSFSIVPPVKFGTTGDKIALYLYAYATTIEDDTDYTESQYIKTETI